MSRMNAQNVIKRAQAAEGEHTSDGLRQRRGENVGNTKPAFDRTGGSANTNSAANNGGNKKKKKNSGVLNSANNANVNQAVAPLPQEDYTKNNKGILTELFFCYAFGVAAQAIYFVCLRQMMANPGKKGGSDSASDSAKPRENVDSTASNSSAAEPDGRQYQDFVIRDPVEGAEVLSACMLVYSLGKLTQGRCIVDVFGGPFAVVLNIVGLAVSLIGVSFSTSSSDVIFWLGLQHYCLAGCFPAAAKFFGSDTDFPQKSSAISILSLSGRCGALFSSNITSVAKVVNRKSMVNGIGMTKNAGKALFWGGGVASALAVFGVETGSAGAGSVAGGAASGAASAGGLRGLISTIGVFLSYLSATMFGSAAYLKLYSLYGLAMLYLQDNFVPLLPTNFVIFMSETSALMLTEVTTLWSRLSAHGGVLFEWLLTMSDQFTDVAASYFSQISTFLSTAAVPFLYNFFLPPLLTVKSLFFYALAQLASILNNLAAEGVASGNLNVSIASALNTGLSWLLSWEFAEIKLLFLPQILMDLIASGVTYLSHIWKFLMLLDTPELCNVVFREFPRALLGLGDEAVAIFRSDPNSPAAASARMRGTAGEGGGSVGGGTSEVLEKVWIDFKTLIGLFLDVVYDTGAKAHGVIETGMMATSAGNVDGGSGESEDTQGSDPVSLISRWRVFHRTLGFLGLSFAMYLLFFGLKRRPTSSTKEAAKARKDLKNGGDGNANKNSPSALKYLMQGDYWCIALYVAFTGLCQKFIEQALASTPAAASFYQAGMIIGLMFFQQYYCSRIRSFGWLCLGLLMAFCCCQFPGVLPEYNDVWDQLLLPLCFLIGATLSYCYYLPGSLWATTRPEKELSATLSAMMDLPGFMFAIFLQKLNGKLQVLYGAEATYGMVFAMMALSCVLWEIAAHKRYLVV